MFTQFTLIQGMVLLGPQTIVEEGLRHWQHTFVPFSRWRYERFANHIHGCDSDLGQTLAFVPAFDLPAFDLPAFDLPAFDLPASKDAA
jgi:hypothetical protein